MIRCLMLKADTCNAKGDARFGPLADLQGIPNAFVATGLMVLLLLGRQNPGLAISSG